MARPFSPSDTKAVFFDMNNTLIDAQGSFDLSFVSVLSDFAGRWDDGGGRPDPQQALNVYKEEWSKQKERVRAKPKEADIVKQQCLTTALRPYPFRVNDFFADSFLKEIRLRAKENPLLYPYAREAVAILARRYLVGIVTNGNKEQQAKTIASVNLSSYVPAERIIASDLAGARKPEPGIFRAAIRSCGFSAPETVMVGDSWKNDVGGAIKSGMRAVWMNRSPSSRGERRKFGKQLVPVVTDFEQLLALFGE